MSEPSHPGGSSGGSSGGQEPRTESEAPAPSEPSASPARRPKSGGRERALRVGWPAAALGVWSVLHWAALIAGALPLLSAGWTAGEAPAPWAAAVVFGPSAGITLALAIVVIVRVARLAAGTAGRARLMLLSVGSLLRAAGFGAMGTVVGLALRSPDALSVGLGLGGSLMPVGEVPTLWESIALVATAQGTYTVLLVALAVSALGVLIELASAVASWFLLSARVRGRLWIVADTLLLGGFVAVTLLLPLQPEQISGAATLPAVRLAVTTVFVARVLMWLLPHVMNLVERLGFATLVSTRMLRARKSGFLTTIGALSILAVAFSSCTLTTTLSVMGGFRNDLKRKILGNNAHVVLDREHGTFEGWDPTLQRVREQPDVVAATPYVQGEVMITSATNLAGAVIRGIDPDTIGDVTELPRNLRHGRMDYLREPERLLRLRADEMRRSLLAPPMGSDAEPPPLQGERGSFFEDVEEVLEEGERREGGAGGGGRPEGAGRHPDNARIEEEIAEFLLPEDEAEGSGAAGSGAAGFGAQGSESAGGPGSGPEAEPDGRHVLPGLIVGQELARTLRLHVGDEVDVVSPLGDLGPAGPIPRTRPFRVAGIFYSGMYEFDMKMAYTTLEAAQGFLNVGDAISGIEVKVEDTDRAVEVAGAVQGTIERDDLRVRAWQEVNRNLFGALQLEKLAMFITLGIAILVASFCIVGTLTLMVQEKGKEVGILKAMGTSDNQVVTLFMAQGLMIGLLGAAVGLGLGYVTCFAMEHFGVHLNPEVYYIDRLPVHIDPMEFVWTGIASVVVCLLATIYPAILGSRLRPVDALRYA